MNNEWSCARCGGRGGRYLLGKWLGCAKCSGTGNRHAKPGRVKRHKSVKPAAKPLSGFGEGICPPLDGDIGPDSPVRAGKAPKPRRAARKAERCALTPDMFPER